MATDAIYDPKATTVPVLRYLVALADHRHFGRAAAAAMVSQPTLSAMVAKWESRMGITVFERDTHGVRTTPAGERVVAAARRALAALEAVESAAGEATAPFFGPVRLGVIPTIGPYTLPWLMPAIEKAHPDLTLPITEATTGDLLAALDAGRLDCALLSPLPGMEPRLTVEHIYTEPFFAALPKGHRLAGRARLDAGDLTGERLLLLAEGHCMREQALAVCGRLIDAGRGADWRATSLETLRQLVAAGAGITVLPALATDPEDRRIIALPLEGNGRQVALVWRTGDGRAAAYRLLAGPIRRALPASVRGT
jgi:LysR family hydrogen peroxide-inducible transcriptional activator